MATSIPSATRRARFQGQFGLQARGRSLSSRGTPSLRPSIPNLGPGYAGGRGKTRTRWGGTGTPSAPRGNAGSGGGAGGGGGGGRRELPPRCRARPPDPSELVALARLQALVEEAKRGRGDGRARMATALEEAVEGLRAGDGDAGLEGEEGQEGGGGRGGEAAGGAGKPPAAPPPPRSPYATELAAGDAERTRDRARLDEYALRIEAGEDPRAVERSLGIKGTTGWESGAGGAGEAPGERELGGGETAGEGEGKTRGGRTEGGRWTRPKLRRAVARVAAGLWAREPAPGGGGIWAGPGHGAGAEGPSSWGVLGDLDVDTPAPDLTADEERVTRAAERVSYVLLRAHGKCADVRESARRLGALGLLAPDVVFADHFVPRLEGPPALEAYLEAVHRAGWRQEISNLALVLVRRPGDPVESGDERGAGPGEVDGGGAGDDRARANEVDGDQTISDETGGLGEGAGGCAAGRASTATRTAAAAAHLPAYEILVDTFLHAPLPAWYESYLDLHPDSGGPGASPGARPPAARSQRQPRYREARVASDLGGGVVRILTRDAARAAGLPPAVPTFYPLDPKAPGFVSFCEGDDDSAAATLAGRVTHRLPRRSWAPRDASLPPHAPVVAAFEDGRERGSQVPDIAALAPARRGVAWCANAAAISVDDHARPAHTRAAYAALNAGAMSLPWERWVAGTGRDAERGEGQGGRGGSRGAGDSGGRTPLARPADPRWGPLPASEGLAPGPSARVDPGRPRSPSLGAPPPPSLPETPGPSRRAWPTLPTAAELRREAREKLRALRDLGLAGVRKLVGQLPREGRRRDLGAQAEPGTAWLSGEVLTVCATWRYRVDPARGLVDGATLTWGAAAGPMRRPRDAADLFACQVGDLRERLLDLSLDGSAERQAYAPPAPWQDVDDPAGDWEREEGMVLDEGGLAGLAGEGLTRSPRQLAKALLAVARRLRVLPDDADGDAIWAARAPATKEAREREKELRARRERGES